MSILLFQQLLFKITFQPGSSFHTATRRPGLAFKLHISSVSSVMYVSIKKVKVQVKGYVSGERGGSAAHDPRHRCNPHVGAHKQWGDGIQGGANSSQCKSLDVVMGYIPPDRV